MTLFKIGFKRPQSLPKFIIPHTTADMIYNHVGEKGLNAHTDNTSIGMLNGEKVRFITTVEEKQQELVRLKAFETWVNENCETRPCKTLLDYDTQKWHHFKNALGTYVFESALLSMETGGVLICDDHATLRMIDEELQVKGAWTQSAIQSLVVRNLITLEQAYDYYLGLIQLRHRHTTVDKDMILYILGINSYAINADVAAVINILSGYYSDENSLQISFAIIADLSKMLLPPKQFEQLTYYLLMRFISGRQVFPLYTRFYRLSDYYITDPQLSLIVKHAIWQLINDHHFPTLKSIRH